MIFPSNQMALSSVCLSPLAIPLPCVTSGLVPLLLYETDHTAASHDGRSRRPGLPTWRCARGIRCERRLCLHAASVYHTLASPSQFFSPACCSSARLTVAIQVTYLSVYVWRVVTSPCPLFLMIPLKLLFNTAFNHIFSVLSFSFLVL